MPLFGPIAVPIIVGLLKELIGFLRRRKAKRAQVVKPVQHSETGQTASLGGTEVGLAGVVDAKKQLDGDGGASEEVQRNEMSREVVSGRVDHEGPKRTLRPRVVRTGSRLAD